MPIRAGVDLGGTKIEIAALDSAGAVRVRRRVDTPAGDYAATLEAIAALVEGVERELGEAVHVGLATPGSASLRTGLIRNANSTCLNGRPLKSDLQARLAREIRMENDANCFALSEAIDGAGEGARVVFGVILGTGVGGGIVVDGRLLTGVNAVAGEWGHNPLPAMTGIDLPPRACYCGRSGCIETYLSGPALAADSGDGRMERYEERLARALASVVNLLDPDVIVVGGGVSNIPRLYDNVPRLWGRHIFSDEVRTRLVPARFGDSSGVRGAAWLWGDRDL